MFVCLKKGQGAYFPKSGDQTAPNTKDLHLLGLFQTSNKLLATPCDDNLGSKKRETHGQRRRNSKILAKRLVGSGGQA